MSPFRSTTCAIVIVLAAGLTMNTAQASLGGASATRYEQAVSRINGPAILSTKDTPQIKLQMVPLAEVGADADLAPGFGPASAPSGSDQMLAPGCPYGYYFWLSNNSAFNLTIDYIRIDDPVLPPGGPYFFAQNLVIPPFQVVSGWLNPPPGFCATRLETQYNFNGGIARANQKFYHNFAYYSFVWQWFTVRNLAPGQAVAYFNTSGLYPPPQGPSIASSGPTPCRNPWTGDTSCDSPFASWDVDRGSVVGFAPGFNSGGIIGLGGLMLLLGIRAARARARHSASRA